MLLGEKNTLTKNHEDRGQIFYNYEKIKQAKVIFKLKVTRSCFRCDILAPRDEAGDSKNKFWIFSRRRIFFRNGSRLLAETTATAEKAFLFRRRQTTSSSSTEIMAASATTRCYVAKLFAVFSSTGNNKSFLIFILFYEVLSPRKQSNQKHTHSSGLPAKENIYLSILHGVATFKLTIL